MPAKTEKYQNQYTAARAVALKKTITPLIVADHLKIVTVSMQ